MTRTPPLESPLVPERLLMPREVAQMLRVRPQTVARWAKNGLLPCQWTLGGHRRYKESVVRALLDGNTTHQN